MKNIKDLESFTAYCKENPQQRFWQALRNWNQIKHPKQNFIFTAEMDVQNTLEDTFYR